MTIAHRIRKLALNFGIEMNRYNPAQSQEARMARLLAHHGIDLVLDVGANTGGYGRSLREAGFQGDILSFEPLEQAYAELTRAAASDTRWHIAPRMAVGAENGEIEINVAGNSVSSSILPMHETHAAAAPLSRYVGCQRVPLSQLDSVLHPVLTPDRITLLKIDTQGYEMPVLLGATALLPHIRGVQIELSLVPLYEGQILYREMIDWLTDNGFELWNVIPGFLDTFTGRQLQFDGVFFRNK
ncbi:MAG: FkbM family methyltransferase [Sulfuriferula multivorans]|uniref:FkbM family methyltransferase n=1 Tax=Sulfuriferula multivorans TaxID=1559896 RepID=A0A7C9JW66_9PROT|nr:FkbM family methyltransferase [Sulfuriferula multivorans]